MTMPRLRKRHGFTMIELLIVMVVMGVVTAALVRGLNNASRVSQAQAQKSDMQSNLRAGAGFLPAEFREIANDASSSDLLAVSKDSVTYNAMRNFGLACNVSSNTITVRNSSMFGVSGLASYTKILLYQEQEDTMTTDDTWRAFTYNNPTNTTCPDGAAATRLSLLGGATVNTDSIQLDAPVRTYEKVTVKVYQSDGQWWLGMSTDDNAIQPVLGPLSAADSTFGFRTGAGAATTTLSQVRVIEATLHGQTTNAISKSGYDTRQLATDSIRLRVRLRNAP
jgi:prepilin-type N-terminal cleavage/methylation domain-containing protein